MPFKRTLGDGPPHLTLGPMTSGVVRTIWVQVWQSRPRRIGSPPEDPGEEPGQGLVLPAPPSNTRCPLE